MSLDPRIGLVAVLASSLVACGESAKLALADGMGADPRLPPPRNTVIPTVHIASAVGWPRDAKPVAAAGMSVAAFAQGLEHPRWLYVLPNGDVLVAETSAPPKPDDYRGIKGWFMKRAYRKAGSAVPSANRITLLRDVDGDGVAEIRHAFVENLNSPFGMALIGEDFYVATTDAVLRFAYREGDMRLAGPAVKVVDLPAGHLNHHWTKNLLASADGSHLYVTVGSNSNAAENGMDKETGRAAVWEVDLKTGTYRVFASGLRNPVGLAWETPGSALWVSVNERDELGSDLVPDYMTALKEGGFYGWPYSYYGRHVDERVKPQRPDLVAKALVPDYALGAHTASLGLAWSAQNALPPPFQRGMFVGQHGSWNRKPASGYKVIFVPFDSAGRPVGAPLEVLTGFLDAEGRALGRPVGVTLDQRGALLVADDVGNTVWRVAATGQTTASSSR